MSQLLLDTGASFWFRSSSFGNSEQWKMTGHEDNVGFLATGSGVKQFQLSSGDALSLRVRHIMLGKTRRTE
jgi:hypothetical protein